MRKIDEKYLKNIPDLVQQYNQQLKENAERTVLNKLVNQINNIYWDSCVELARDKVPPEITKEYIEFTDGEKMFLDYTIYSDEVEWQQRLLEEISEGNKYEGEYNIITVSEGLNLNYQQTIFLKERKQLSRDILRLKTEIKRLPLKIEELREKREFFSQYFLDRASRLKLRHICKEVESILTEYTKLEHMVNSGQMKDKAERLKYVNMKKKILEAYRERTGIFTVNEDSGAIQSLTRRIEDRIKREFFLSLEIKNLEAQLEDMEKKLSEITLNLKKMAQSDYIKMIRMLLSMCAKRSRILFTSVLMGYRKIITKKEIAEAVNKVEQMDPTIFENRMVKRFGMPSFQIAPGIGNGVFDWEKNRIIIPTIPLKDAVESVAYGLVMYKDDVDSQTNDRMLMKSYASDIKENTKIRSSQALKRKFAKEYVLWITKEAQGYGVLDKDVKEWFEKNIAPKKNELKLDKEFRGITTRKAREILAHGTVDMPKDKEHFLRGVCYNIIGMTEKAIEEFQEVIKINPEYYDAYYNLGILCKKTGMAKQKYYFTQYVKLAPQSWWSKKALEHLRDAR